MSPAIGSLFSGSGMLDEAVLSVLGGDVAWHAEIDPAASRVLEHRYPDVPNLGDLTAVDWAGVPGVDVLTGGFPCQDVSHAGKRAGLRAGTRSGLWARMCDAIDQLRPALVVAENVRGLLSAEADSALEPCPGCVGDDGDGAVLRALGRVLGDLADLGYDASWYGLRAADVGAPHGRFRVFIAARNAAHRRRDDARPTRPGSDRQPARPARGSSGAAADATGSWPAGWFRDERASEWGELGCAESGSCDPPITGRAGRETFESPTTAWGPYEPAIQRWEQRLGRIAPPPTETGAKGGQRLSPRFVEWMMGWPDGWVTDVPGITRNDALRICGNGVVPQQAAEALRALLAAEPLGVSA